jgi:hypothetical protein
MNRMGQGLFDSSIIELGQLLINLFELIPMIFSKSINKSGEVEGRIITNILIA